MSENPRPSYGALVDALRAAERRIAELAAERDQQIEENERLRILVASAERVWQNHLRGVEPC